MGDLLEMATLISKSVLYEDLFKNMLCFQNNLLNLHETKIIINTEEMSRLKVVLCEKQRTSKWLAEEFSRNVSTVSTLGSDTIQPDLATFFSIADVLDIDVKLLKRNKA